MPRTEQVSFELALSPLEGMEVHKYVPIDGTIVSVGFHFPDGCDALVGAQFGHGKSQLFPNDGLLALNDASPVYPANEPVKFEDVLWVIAENGDGANPHTISVTATIIGE